MEYTTICLSLVFLCSVLHPIDALILNCPETDEENQDATEIQQYFHLRCDRVCKKQKKEWNNSDPFQNDYIDLFEKYDSCFRLCATVMVGRIRAVDFGSEVRNNMSAKQEEKVTCRDTCMKKDKGRAIGNALNELRLACSELCEELVETIARGKTWTMYFPAKIPKTLEKRALAELETKRTSLLEEVETVSDIYCTRKALKQLKRYTGSGRVTLEQLHHRCRHVDTNLSERDPYFCLIYLKKE